MSEVGADPWGFDTERQALARRYRTRRRRLSAVRSGVFLVFFVFLVLGGSLAIQGWSRSLGLAGWAANAVFLVALVALAEVIDLPFAYVSGFRWEVESGLSTRGAASWAWDRVKAFALGLAFVLVAGQVVLWLLEVQPSWWWLVAFALGLALAAAIGFLAPILLVPLFFRSRPVQDEAVRKRLESLAARAGVPVLGAFEINASAKTRRANAGVMGFGRTRRIVLTDTLLRGYTADETETILAHELGHQAFRDPFTGFLANAIASFVVLGAAAGLYGATAPAFGLASLHEPAGLPLLAFYGGLVAAALGPLELAWSRRRESRADQFALDLTRLPDAFGRAIVKLHDENLAVADPRRWELWLLYSHPSGRTRVEAARTWRPAT